MQQHELNLIENLYKKKLSSRELIILTPNNRLAIYLYRLWDSYQQQTLSHNKFNIKPLILTFEQWLRMVWEQTEKPNILLLNKLQEKFFLQQTIEIKNQENMLHIDYNALFSAWELLNKWQISLNKVTEFQLNDEVIFFLDNIKLYYSFLQQNQYCNYTQIASILNNIYQHNDKALPNIMQNLLLVGFDDFNLTPSETQFITMLQQQRNIKIEYFDPNQQNSQKYQLSLPTVYEEIKAMAKWTYDISQAQPNAKIACIVPQLNIVRDDLIRIFTQIFAENNVALYQNTLPDNIHLSLGKSLASYPIIDIILTFLQINVLDDFKFETIQKILTSPFIDNNWEEYVNNYAILAKIKQHILQLPIKTFKFQDIQHILCENCLRIYEIINQYLQLQRSKERKKMHEWWSIINEFLDKLGWYGQRLLNDEEQQVVEKWHELEQHLISLDLPSTLPNLQHGFSLQEFIVQLRLLTQTTIFQPSFLSKKNHTDIQINILGMLEANGMNFDYMWIMGMDDNALPTPLQPNIFLPLALQRYYDMPHVKIEQELHFSTTLQQRFHRSAKFIIYSYAQQQESNQNSVSPLLSNIPQITLKELYSLNKMDDKFCTSINLLAETIYAENYNNYKNTLINHDLIKNNSGDSVFYDEHHNNININYTNDKIFGGTELIQMQIDCPFKCFATYRLKAKELQKFSYKIWRGNIIHKAQEYLWQEIHDYTTLQNYFTVANQQTNLSLLIQKSIDFAINHPKIIGSKIIKQYAKKFLELEKQYITKLLYKCLELEFEFRQPFTIKFLEKHMNYTFGNLELHFIIDRIDQLENGNWIIIDYKTGKNLPSNKKLIPVMKNNQLKNENNNIKTIEQAQLPLYYLAFQANNDNEQTNKHKQISAILYANANMQQFYQAHNNPAKQSYFHGIIDINEQECFKTNKLTTYDFSILEQQWLECINSLANDFLQGKANLRPQNDNICRKCDLRLLCRRT